MFDRGVDHTHGPNRHSMNTKEDDACEVAAPAASAPATSEPPVPATG